MDFSKFSVQEIRYEDILPLWRDFLWKDRKDPLRPMSSMTFEGGTDMSIYQKYEPVFFGLFSEGRLIGCNSCHPTAQQSLRSRGLFILPEFRGQGLSQKLFQAIQEKAIQNGNEFIWSYPRKESLKAYTNFSFLVHRDSELSRDHCYVWKKV